MTNTPETKIATIKIGAYASAQGPLAKTWTVNGVAWASVYVGKWKTAKGVLVQ